jgi:hypothetical protein
MDLTQLSWTDLQSPVAMAAITVVAMSIFFKPLIRLLVDALAPEAPDDWPVEKFAVNVVTIGVVFTTGFFLLGEVTGALYVLTVVASGLCIMGYEGIKNALSMVGIDISNIGLLLTKLGAK